MAREIVETERAYVRDLRSIVEVRQEGTRAQWGSRPAPPPRNPNHPYRTSWAPCWMAGSWG